MLTITPARPGRRARRALLAAVLVVAALPTAAQAASVTDGVNNGRHVVNVFDRGFFSGGTVESNNASVAIEGDFLVIRDTAGITTEHQGSVPGTCVRVTSIQARCPRTVGEIFVSLGAGGDHLEYRAPVKGFVDMGVDNDTVFGGRRAASGRLMEGVTYSGGPGFDTVSYLRADRGVQVKLENTRVPTFDDGRPGDREGIGADVEIIEGSNFDDTLFGSLRGETFRALNGNDRIEAGDGNDLFDEGFSPNGADSIFGDAGAHDRVFYANRPSGVEVLLDGVRNDGATGEQDNVGASVEDISGTAFRDVLTGGTPDNTIDGFGGPDTITGGRGNDTLSAGGSNNGVLGGIGNDVIEARNGEIDDIDCGENAGDSDTANRDSSENRVTGCERGAVGVLRVTPKVLRAEAGETARMKLGWRHPRAWKQLRTIALRLVADDGRAVGEVTIRPRRDRIAGDGAIRVKRGRIVTRGKTVMARLALRLDASLAGQTLRAEVEAIDQRGRRQLERDAATVRVAR